MNFFLFFCVVFYSFLGISVTNQPEWVVDGRKWLAIPGHVRVINQTIFSIQGANQPIAILKLGSTSQETLICQIMHVLGLEETVPLNVLAKDLEIPEGVIELAHLNVYEYETEEQARSAIDTLRTKIESKTSLGHKLITATNSMYVLEKPVIFVPNAREHGTLRTELQKILKETGLFEKEGGTLSLQELSSKISPESFSFFQRHLNKKSVQKAFLYYFITNAHDLYKRNILIHSDGQEFFIKCIDHDQTLEIKKSKDQNIGVIGDKTDVFGLYSIDELIDPSLYALILSWDLTQIRAQLTPLFHQSHISPDKLKALLSRIQALKTIVTLSKGKILPRNLDTLASLLVETDHEFPPSLLVEDKLGDSYHVNWILQGRRIASSDISNLPLIEHCLKRNSEINGRKYSGWLLLKMLIKYNKEKIDPSMNDSEKIRKWIEIIKPYIDADSPLYVGLIDQIPLIRNEQLFVAARQKPAVPPKPKALSLPQDQPISIIPKSKPPIIHPKPTRSVLSLHKPNQSTEEEFSTQETLSSKKPSVKDLVRKFDMKSSNN